MGCGCGGGKKNTTRSFNSPRPTMSASLTSSQHVNPNLKVSNIKPMGMVQLPPPAGLNDADKRRIQKLRQEALNRSLGRRLT